MDENYRRYRQTDEEKSRQAEALKKRFRAYLEPRKRTQPIWAWLALIALLGWLYFGKPWGYVLSIWRLV